MSGAGQAEFGASNTQAGVTDGNLSVHLRKLEDAGYVRVDKSFVGRKPLTMIVLTPEGRSAWMAYLDRMHAVLLGIRSWTRKTGMAAIDQTTTLSPI